MDLRIQGKTALVAGGTKGIGKAIVATFVAEGANVGFCARNADEVAAIEASFADAEPTVVGTVLDVADAAALTAWVDDSAVTFGGIDMIVANVSALAIPDTAENWQASIAVDLMGTVNLVTASLPYLRSSESPSIIAISSVSGREVDFASGPYGTIKTALVGYIAGVAFQLAGEGIRANTVSPGNTYEEGGVWASIESGNPELFSSVMAANPTGRMGTTQEIANGVVFLSSPVSSRTTGANLLIDGAVSRGIQL
ncbi:MAG: 3-ketoacyl-ACP reductase [Glaciihabitans sp.]|nr:3-ketoacyl-ACP reductase [Glaciihabitans sp.]